MAPLLRVEDLHAGYGSGSVLRGVALEVQTGEVVSLLGRNGMGKSTTVRAIMGLLRPSRGAIVFRGVPQQGRPCHEVARAGIGLVPEGRQLMTNPELLLLDEATEGLAPLVRAEIWRCLGELKAGGQAILVIDKNIGPLKRL